VNPADFRRLEASLLEDWRAGLSAFAASPDNVRVYALAVNFDSEYAMPALCINTERGLEQMVKRYPDQSPDKLRRFGGTGWNPPDFLHFNIAPASEATTQLCARYEAKLQNCTDRVAAALANRLAETLLSAITRLSDSLHILDRTPDFIAYLWPVHVSAAGFVALMRRTVVAAQFERMFPEVRATEKVMAELGQRPTAEQAGFWASALCDLVLDVASPSTDMLRGLGRTQYDATDALKALGADAIPELVRIAEENALPHEFNERGSAEWERHGAFTPRAMLASSAFLALMELTGGSDEMIDRLQALLQRLYERDRGLAKAGLNGQLTARALHALRPRLFPNAQFSGSTNHLLNFVDFGVRA
jgi:hypothetical protein